MRAFLNTVPVAVEAIDNGIVFDLIVALYCGTQSAMVRITHYHTNIVSIKKNGEVILERTEEKGGACGGENPAETGLTDRSLLNVADIYDFANTCDLADIRPCWIRRSGTTRRSLRRACAGITAPTSVPPC